MPREFGIKTMEVIRALAQSAPDDVVSDGDLLARYARDHDDTAFAMLVRRHAAMVLGVARRVLQHGHDAEDVCQATFLLLSRKPASGLRRESVAGWLCATARLTALNSRRAKARRTKAEGRDRFPRSANRTPLDQMTGAELVQTLDEELARLPDRYRGPLVLCCLEGLTRETAARRLGVPVGTLRIQMERGRERLRLALEKRGIELGMVLLAVVTASAARASSQVIKSVLRTVGGVIPPAVAALCRGGIMTISASKFALVAALAIALGVAATGARRLAVEETNAPAEIKAPETSHPTDSRWKPQQGPDIDLVRVQRTIAKEPIYKSKPEYCLLVFDAQAQSKVWLVLDGNTLYVDRNGDGDLTEEGKRVVTTKGEGDLSLFEAGDLHVGGKIHKNLRLGLRSLQTVGDRNDLIKEHLARHPGAKGHSLALDVEDARYGLGKRVQRFVLGWDTTGVLTFGASPAQAPMLFMDGPLQISLFQQEKLTIGRASEVYLAVGTPGKGAGATTYVGYEGVVPENAIPRCEIVYPSRTQGDPPHKQVVDFKQRCCAYNFWDSLRVPDVAGPGKAVVHLSFDSWKDGHVRPSTGEIEVVAPKQFDIAPVSKRLKGSLAHANTKAYLYNIRFSPDGRRILAGDYPGGVVQIWDANSGKVLTKIETSQSNRATCEYCYLTPGWEKLFVARTRKRQATPIEVNGKRLVRWDYEGDVRAWDVNTGAVTDVFENNPSLGESYMDLAPDGSTFVTFGNQSGQFAQESAFAVNLWDLRTKKSRTLPGDLSPVPAFSPDSKTLAIQAHEGAKKNAISIKLFDVSTASEKLSMPILEKEAKRIGYMAFSPDGKVLVGQVRDEQVTGQHWLKFWDPGTGRELASFAGDNRDYFLLMAFSKDGHTLAVTTSKQNGPCRIFLFDLEKHILKKSIVLDSNTTACALAFRPDGKWLAVGTLVFPADLGNREMDPADIPQARIQLVSVESGARVETIIAPQGVPGSLCFSPDGKTLATSGTGCVLLWDVAEK